jgi:spore coat protein U-like protein
MTRPRLLPVCVFVLGIVFATDASAAPSCTISATSVNFGSYNVFTASATDSTGSVTISCNGSAHNVVVSLSKGSSTTFNPRTMLKGTETLSYNLYRDAARTSIWGDGTGGTSTYTNANPSNNSDIIVTIFGRVPAGQDVTAGSYSDTVSAVINF